MNPSPRRSPRRHLSAWPRLAARWGWMFGPQSRADREAAMSEFADMPDELRQFVVTECAFAQVQATEELRATLLQVAKVVLQNAPRPDRVDGDLPDDDDDGVEEEADEPEGADDVEGTPPEPPEAA